MLYHDNPVLASPDRIFFLYIITFNSDASVSITFGETVRVSKTMLECLFRSSLDLIKR